MIEFKMPSLGADMEDGLLVEWKKHVGDSVKRGDIIAEVETQKGDIEIEVFDDGVIDSILIKEGERVPVGTVLALIKTSGDVAEKKSVEPAPLPSVRMAVAAAMSKSNREIPHYYLTETVDVEKSLQWLSECNAVLPVAERILPAALWIKAVARSLGDVPELNSVWENGLIHKDEINIGFVVSLRGGGIIVPAIQNADQKSVHEIMSALNDIIPRARESRLRSSELSTATITMTSLGDNAAETVFGVIYPPQVALVGFGGVKQSPTVISGTIIIHRTVRISIAGDHRATDGLTGSRFLMSLAEHLQHPEAL